MPDSGQNHRNLVVEVVGARNLLPKDGQGTASAYAIVDYDGQRRRTKTVFRDLNPQWEEKLEFLVHDPESMASDTVEINVYNDKKTGKRSTFLGKVKISGSSIAKSGSETLVYFPLEKRSVFSQVKGEIGLKISYIDPPPTAPEAEAAAKEKKPGEEKKTEEETKKTEEEKKKPEGEDAKSEAETKSDPAEAPKSEAPADAPAEEKKDEKKEKKKAKEKEEKPAAVEKEKSLAVAEVTAVSSRSAMKDLEIRSLCGGGGSRGGGAFDLVEKVPYLYVRVLKAKPAENTDTDTYAKIVIGSHNVCTRTIKSTDWDQVFAFHKAGLNSTSLEISVFVQNTVETEKDKPPSKVDTCLGSVSFDIHEVPKRAPPDSPLAPQWYTLEGGGPGGDVMLAVWFGTQADESFSEAWQSDSGGSIVHTRSKAYLSPTLWYLRLTVIQTQDLKLSGPKAQPASADLLVKAQLGQQVFKTSKVSAGSSSTWHEDLLFVAAEPFDPFLIISVEEASSAHSVGQAKVPVSGISRRVDDRSVPPSRWFDLHAGDAFAGRIHVRTCLEGGYHVLDESASATSDVRAASKQLSRPPVGTVEVGVRGATNLLPMKPSGTTDAYAVIKYGPKWARTRTILDSFNPRWDEQYAWDVYDPCTVLTVAVFDNTKHKSGSKDTRIGKIRIRLSTLDTKRTYINSYPLMVLHPSGAKKMGELELAIVFKCNSWISLIQAYASPLLPRMHYAHPLGPGQQDLLRHTAMQIVSARLGRSEPPLGPEVVQYMLDSDAHLWSMRRSKANWFRAVHCLTRSAEFARWVRGVRAWTHPSTTLLVHALLVIIVLCPHLILPTLFMYLFLIVLWRYRGRPAVPAGMDARLSHVDAVGLDELDEEFDGFPSSRPPEQVRARYDRLRALAGRAQTLLGDMAAQGERVEALLGWRDPRATGLFAGACAVAALVFYAVPFRVVVLLMGFYYLRHPRFRDEMPPVGVSFFRRIPSLSDRVL
ncbi:hypothetical protein QJS04_geneDACA013004 [Acorus gramineus]|uniref:C2 domain-containing protein n=1 Tax=Acorus gramineus TaxID=55184 RepID=A0AAV9B6A2_ACOGR|nr:hypothetical protein QJS04_geneDACA013004 [Acorus gramineus]